MITPFITILMFIKMLVKGFERPDFFTTQEFLNIYTVCKDIYG